MGTNYYVVPNRPSVEGPIHIGKTSFGWRFLFQTQNAKWQDPPVVWSSWPEVQDWLKKYVVEKQSHVILNEYDENISYSYFERLVEDLQNVDNPDDFTYCRNVNGYRFTDSEFC